MEKTESISELFVGTIQPSCHLSLKVNSLSLEVIDIWLILFKIENGESPDEAAKRELKEETGYEAQKIVSLGHYNLDYSMFEQNGNIFAAYDLLANKGTKSKQSLGKMEKIEIDVMTIDDIKRLLSQGKILNAASIVAFHKALEFHEQYII